MSCIVKVDLKSCFFRFFVHLTPILISSVSWTDWSIWEIGSWSWRHSYGYRRWFCWVRKYSFKKKKIIWCAVDIYVLYLDVTSFAGQIFFCYFHFFASVFLPYFYSSHPLLLLLSGLISFWFFCLLGRLRHLVVH